MQGDVVAIYNTSGVLQAKYSYDAWENCTVTNSTNAPIANYNPIRYRGYYYDTETNWYFLNARYYSPEWRRFISPDDTSYLDPENVNGCNLYAYCNNDPVNFVDPSGHFLIGLGIISFFAFAAIGTIVGIATAVIEIAIVVRDISDAIYRSFMEFWYFINNDMTFSDVHNAVGASNNGSAKSTHIGALYDFYGGPGADLREAIYQEYYGN